MKNLPLLPVSSIGSLPKPPDLFRAEMAPLEQQDHAWMRRSQETAVADWIATQEKLGIDVLVDGEQYRRSMTTSFLEGWGCADIDPDPVWVLDNMYGQRAVIKRRGHRAAHVASRLVPLRRIPRTERRKGHGHRPLYVAGLGLRSLLSRSPRGSAGVGGVRP